jgi:hypothetical protein
VPQLARTLGLPEQLDEILGGMLVKDHLNRYNDLGPAISELDELRTAIATRPQGSIAGRLAGAVRLLTKK